MVSAALSLQVQAATLASYQAFYELDLKSTTAAAEVNSVSGKTHYVVKKVCDGWASSENYAISFGFEEGEPANFISHYKTWESDEGSSFTFEIAENSNATGEAIFEGFANNQDGKVEAFHSDGDGAMRLLPDDTIFPMQHLIGLLEAGKVSAPVIRQSHLFFGGEQTDSLYFISAVMGKKKSSVLQKDMAEKMGDLGENDYWPLTIAYYKPDAQESEPEYSIAFELQPNGVIRGYVVDYGSFSMQASLKTVEPIQPEDCN